MRDIAVKTDNAGDTLSAGAFNAQEAEIENVVTDTGQTLDSESGPDTDLNMLGKALAAYGASAEGYTDSGSANTYVLARASTLQSPTAYFDGMRVTFIPANTNTTACTVNVAGIGTKDIVGSDGNALIANDIVADTVVSAVYVSGDDEFRLIEDNAQDSVGNPSEIINGGFDIWQTGTTQTSSGYASDDMWFNAHTGSTKTASRRAFTLGQVAVPGNPTYHARTVVTAGAGAGDFVSKSQRVEGVKTLANETATLSFWAKSLTTPDLSVNFTQHFGTGGSPSSDVDTIGVVKFSLTTTWQKFVHIVNIPSVSGKTLGADGNDYLQVQFWFDAGSDFNSVTDSLGHQTGTFDLAQVKLERGRKATPFISQKIGNVLRDCQRYYCKSYKQDIAPGTAGQADQGNPNPVAGTTSFLGCMISFPVIMRATPTVTIYSPGGGNSGKVEDTVQTEQTGSVSVVETSEYGIGLVKYDTASFTKGDLYQFHYTADARL
jgi:hypothetical protein